MAAVYDRRCFCRIGTGHALADAVSMLLLAIPLCLLYEVGIGAARFVAPNDADENENA